MILRPFDLSRVARLAEDDSGTNERRSLPARKEPRSITLRTRTTEIDRSRDGSRGTKTEEKPTVDPIVTTPRARIAEAREPPQGIDIFESSRTEVSMSYLTTLYKYNNIS